MPTQKTTKDKKDSQQSRPPVVVILGHVDHGKTSILDYIRKSKVAEKESGGITQHVGAYQVQHPVKDPLSPTGQANKTITFIDTPGHEAFSAIRSRGAKVADIAILVVAADDGVKPQTKEAISHILRLELPLIVALNKMDKPNILPDKVKKELADNKVLVESLGGQVPSVFVSAKTGLGINDLLEMILLLAEMNNLKADYTQPASGVIIESRLDSQKGATTTLLVQSGTLKNKDIVSAESTYGSIKSMTDFLNQPLDQAEPSTPVLITGFQDVPPVGEEWQVMSSVEEAKVKSEAKAIKEKHKRDHAEILKVTPGQKIFNLILKADVFGSLEALRESLSSIPKEEIILRVLKAEVGDITENDLKLAESARANIYGFRVKSRADIDTLAERKQIRVRLSQIIYELIQLVRQDASYLLSSEIIRHDLGRVKILASFKQTGQRQIIGGRVTTGKAAKDILFDVYRDEAKIGSGKLFQVQRNKENVAEATKDQECGLSIDSEAIIVKGDILELYKEEHKKREL